MQIDPNTIQWDRAPPPRGPAAAPPIRQVVPPQPRQPPAQTGAQAQYDQLRNAKLAAELAEMAKADQQSTGRVAQVETMLDNLKRIREMTNMGTVGNVAGRDWYKGIPLIGQGSANVDGALEMVTGDLIQQVRLQMQEEGAPVGSRQADTEKEAKRIAASIANLSQTQDVSEFLRGLDRAEAYYTRQLNRLRGTEAPEEEGDTPPAPPTSSSGKERRPLADIFGGAVR